MTGRRVNYKRAQYIVPPHLAFITEISVREIDFKRGADAGGGIHVDLSAVSFDNPVHNRQTQPGAGVLGGEVALENPA